MTKVVLIAGITAFAFGLSATEATAGTSRVEASARARIIDPNEVIILRSRDLTAEGRSRETTGTRAFRSVSIRQVCIDADGHIVQGKVNVQIITIDAQ